MQPTPRAALIVLVNTQMSSNQTRLGSEQACEIEADTPFLFIIQIT